MTPRFIRLAKTNVILLALVVCAGCASLRSTSSNRLDQQIARADAAYLTLDTNHVTAYNNAVASIARLIDGGTLRPVVGAVFPLAEARQAYQHKPVRGKVVLRMVDGGGAT